MTVRKEGMTFKYPAGVDLQEKYTGKDIAGKLVTIDRYQPTKEKEEGVLFDMKSQRLVRPLKEAKPPLDWRRSFYGKERIQSGREIVATSMTVHADTAIRCY